MREEPEHRQRLLENAAYYRAGLRDLGGGLLEQSLAGASDRARGQGKMLPASGPCFGSTAFFTVMAIAPGVPVGKDLIRTSVTALHTREQLDRFLAALGTALKKVGFKAFLIQWMPLNWSRNHNNNGSIWLIKRSTWKMRCQQTHGRTGSQAARILQALQPRNARRHSPLSTRG